MLQDKEKKFFDLLLKRNQLVYTTETNFEL